MSWAQGQPVLRPLERIQPTLFKCLLLCNYSHPRENPPEAEGAIAVKSTRVAGAAEAAAQVPGGAAGAGAGRGSHSERLGSRPRPALCRWPRPGPGPGSWTPLTCAGPQHPGRPEAAWG